MKPRNFLLLVIAATVLISAGIWALHSMEESIDLTHVLMFGILFLVVAFAILLGMRRLKSERRGEPSEDELSKLILQKAAATSYYVSLYLWVALIFVDGSRDLDTETAIGAGIVGMSVIFALSWFYHRMKGLKGS